MSKLTIVSANDMIKILNKLGFVEVRQKGSHKFLSHKDGRNTVVPVHSKDLKRGLIKGILKDAGLTDGEYEDIRKSV